jgi:hypothetical protein
MNSYGTQRTVLYGQRARTRSSVPHPHYVIESSSGDDGERVMPLEGHNRVSVRADGAA